MYILQQIWFLMTINKLQMRMDRERTGSFEGQEERIGKHLQFAKLQILPHVVNHHTTPEEKCVFLLVFQSLEKKGCSFLLFPTTQITCYLCS